MSKKLPEETEEIYEDYDYRPEPKQSVVGYLGIIIAILLGSTIIGLSIIFSSGKVPGLGLLTINQANNQNAAITNTNSNSNSANTKVNIPLSPDYPMIGSADAPVTMVEFADFQCPFCKEFQDETFTQIKSNYIDTGIVKFYFVSFPFLGDESTSAAIAAECARQQGQFWPYHDLLYKNQGIENSGTFSDAALKKFAKQVGVNATKFATCQKDPKTADGVNAQFKLGEDSGVQATPTIFINGTKNEGANTFSEYKGLIEAAKKSQ